MTSKDALSHVLQLLTGVEVVITSNGYISRHAYSLAPEAPNRFYMLGSMGMASSIALGLALAQPNRQVVVIEGDGNILMSFGTLPQIGHHRPKNLIHVVLDNARYETTGGQTTISPSVEIATVAVAAGYQRAELLTSRTELTRIMTEAKREDGPTLIAVRVSDAGEEIAPRVSLAPPEIKNRLQQWLCAANPSQRNSSTGKQ